MQQTRKTQEATVTYKDSQTTRDAVFTKVLAWFLDQEIFCGESIMQNDATQLTAPELLSEIADDVLQFDVMWDEE